jgi:hypothetical protein
LHIARLEGRQLVDLGEVVTHFNDMIRIPPEFSSYNKWIVHDRKLITYQLVGNNAKEMRCFENLNETTHPFVEIFNRNKEKFIYDIRDLAIHQELPFGLVVDRNHRADIKMLYLLRWDIDDPDEQFTAINHKLLIMSPLFGIRKTIMSYAYPSLSPDGKWLVIGCFQGNRFSRVNFIAIPISKEYPDFLGIDDLLILNTDGEEEGRRIKSFTWSTDPTARVVSYGNELRKWDLGEVPNAKVIVDGEDGGERR